MCLGLHKGSVGRIFFFISFLFFISGILIFCKIASKDVPHTLHNNHAFLFLETKKLFCLYLNDTFYPSDPYNELFEISGKSGLTILGMQRSMVQLRPFCLFQTSSAPMSISIAYFICTYVCLQYSSSFSTFTTKGYTVSKRIE